MDCLPLDEVCQIGAYYEQAAEIAAVRIREPKYVMIASGDKEIYLFKIGDGYEIWIKESDDGGEEGDASGEEQTP